jgi:hypothetical protein
VTKCSPLSSYHYILHHGTKFSKKTNTFMFFVWQSNDLKSDLHYAVFYMKEQFSY